MMPRVRSPNMIAPWYQLRTTRKAGTAAAPTSPKRASSASGSGKPATWRNHSRASGVRATTSRASVVPTTSPTVKRRNTGTAPGRRSRLMTTSV